MLHPEECYSGAVLVTASFEWEGRGRLEEMGVENSSYFWLHIPFLYPPLQDLKLQLKDSRKKGSGGTTATAGRRGNCWGVKLLKLWGENLLLVILAVLLLADVCCCFTHNFSKVSFHCHMFHGFPCICARTLMWLHKPDVVMCNLAHVCGVSHFSEQGWMEQWCRKSQLKVS